MSKALRLAAMATLLSAAVVQAQTYQTNLVQNLGIQIFGVKQGGTSTNGNLVFTSADMARVDTRQVIQALAAATANSFSSTGRLVLVTPLGGGNAAVQVRDGSTTVDVTSFFLLQPLSGSVTGSLLNTRTGRSVRTVYSIQRFALQDSDGFPALMLHFDVNGMAAQTSTINVNGGPGGDLNSNVAGTGDRNGNLLVLQGSINAFGHTVEVVLSGPGPGV